MLFDGTRASFARWAHAGPGRFELRERLHAGDGRRARLALVRRRAVRLADDAQGRVDDPGRRELRRLRRLPRSRQRPVRRRRAGLRDPDRSDRQPGLDDGCDLQLPGRRQGAARPGAPPAGRVEHLRDHGRRPAGRRAAERSRRQPLRLDERRAPEPRPRLRRPPEPQRRRSRLLPQRPGQGVGRRAAAVRGRDAAHTGRRLLRRTPRRLPLEPDRALRRRRPRRERRGAAPRAHRRRHPRPRNTARNLVLQRAPAGAWTIETTVRVPLRSGSQQAGLLVYRDDGDYVKLVAAAAAGGTVRLRLVGEAGTPSHGTLRRRRRPTAERHLPAAPGEIGLALHGLLESERRELAAAGLGRQRAGSRQGRPTAWSRSGRAAGERRPTRRSSSFASQR